MRKLFCILAIVAAAAAAAAQTPSYLACTGAGRARVCSTPGTVATALPATPNQAATKAYVQNWTFARFCSLSGSCRVFGTVQADHLINGKFYTTGHALCATDETGDPVDCGSPPNAAALNNVLAHGYCTGVATSNATTIYLWGLGASSNQTCVTASTSFGSLAVMAQNYEITNVAAFGTAGVNAASGALTIYVYNVVANAPNLVTTLSAVCTFGTSRTCTASGINYAGSAGDMLLASFSTYTTGETLGSVSLTIQGYFR